MKSDTASVICGIEPSEASRYQFNGLPNPPGRGATFEGSRGFSTHGPQQVKTEKSRSDE